MLVGLPCNASININEQSLFSIVGFVISYTGRGGRGRGIFIREELLKRQSSLCCPCELKPDAFILLLFYFTLFYAFILLLLHFIQWVFHVQIQHTFLTI